MARSDEAEWWFNAVYAAVQEIPHGKVTSYGGWLWCYYPSFLFQTLSSTLLKRRTLIAKAQAISLCYLEDVSWLESTARAFINISDILFIEAERPR